VLSTVYVGLIFVLARSHADCVSAVILFARTLRSSRAGMYGYEIIFVP